jgi:anti-sigma factor RsiW
MIGLTLEEQLREYYSRQLPREEVLERLLEEASTLGGAPGADAARLLARRLWVWALSALFAAGALLGLRTYRSIRSDQDRRVQARMVALEIAVKHLRSESVQIPGSDYGSVSQRMPRLDFRICEPRRLERVGYRLLGARYCSIQGQTAAQLTLRSPSGDIATLYEAAREGKLRNLETGEYDTEGVNVFLWNENGVLMGLAETSAR